MTGDRKTRELLDIMSLLIDRGTERHRDWTNTYMVECKIKNPRKSKRTRRENEGRWGYMNINGEVREMVIT